MKSPAVTFVIFDGFDILDVAGPFEVFGEAGYELTVVAPKAGPVRSDTGLTVHAPHSAANLDLARARLAYRPGVGIAEGLARSLDYYRSLVEAGV